MNKLFLAVFFAGVLMLVFASEAVVAEDQSPHKAQSEHMQEKGHRHWSGKRKDKRARYEKRMGMLKGKQRFLKFTKEYYDSVKDPHAAIGFAVLGIKERHRRAGKPLEAVPELEAVLEDISDRGARNIVLFTIRQIYEHERDKDAFDTVNKRILDENLKSLK